MNKTDDQIFSEIKYARRKYYLEDSVESREMAQANNATVSDEARRIHKEAICIDTCTFYLESYNWILENSGITGLNCTVPGVQDSAGDAMRNIIDYYQIIRDNEEYLMIEHADDLVKAKEQGKIGIILGAQSSEFMYHNDLFASVEAFAKLGIRIAQIAYNHGTFAGDGVTAGNADGGVTAEGITLIKAMEKFGITVDLSHVGERTALTALDNTTKPAICSHSNPIALFNNPRNISDELAKKCASLGGVVGASSYPMLLWDGVNFPTIERFVDTVVYYVDLVGIDHVGIGQDSSAHPGSYPHRDSLHFANLIRNSPIGFQNTIAYKSIVAGRDPLLCCSTEGLSGLANFVNIVEYMLKRGFKETEIKKVLGGNWLRIFRETWK